MQRDIEYILLADAQEGDMVAYEDLQNLLEPDIRRFVRRLIGRHDAVDDIVQDVFISFFMNMNKIDPVENLRPYIYRIARNRCYDELRKDQRRETISLDDEPAQVWVSFTQAHTQPKPEDITHWLLIHLEVQEAMQQLPDNQREALMLYAEESMTYAEIAEVMGTSIGTVKSRVYYAKRTLKQVLSPDTLHILDSEFGKKTKQPLRPEAGNEEMISHEVHEMVQ